MALKVLHVVVSRMQPVRIFAQDNTLATDAVLRTLATITQEPRQKFVLTNHVLQVHAFLRLVHLINVVALMEHVIVRVCGECLF